MEAFIRKARGGETLPAKAPLERRWLQRDEYMSETHCTLRDLGLLEVDEPVRPSSMKQTIDDLLDTSMLQFPFPAIQQKRWCAGSRNMNLPLRRSSTHHSKVLFLVYHKLHYNVTVRFGEA